MIGTWRWNVTLSLCGVVLTLLFSIGSNGLEVTALRCLYAFIAFFALAYLFRALLAVILQPSSPILAEIAAAEASESKGNSVDFSTPDETNELNELLKSQLDGSSIAVNAEPLLFQPLSPPKLISTQNKEPEELAKAIRHLTGG
jgi:hypothetical protein